MRNQMTVAITIQTHAFIIAFSSGSHNSRVSTERTMHSQKVCAELYIYSVFNDACAEQFILSLLDYCCGCSIVPLRNNTVTKCIAGPSKSNQPTSISVSTCGDRSRRYTTCGIHSLKYVTSQSTVVETYSR